MAEHEPLKAGEYRTVGESEYVCHCGTTIEKCVMGPREKQIQVCRYCNMMYLRPWDMEPYFDAVKK